MLATLAMVVVAGSAWLFAARGHRERAILADRRVMSQDLTFFLGMYSLALAAGLVHVRVLHYILAVALLLAYGFYVRRHLRAPQEEEIEREAAGQIQPLYFRRWTGRMTGHPPAGKPPLWLTIVQTAAGLGVIIGGAKLFVSGIEYLAPKLGIPALPFALLLAPVATELPETFNSVLWLRRQRDTLAVGNVTGAMVFQSAFPAGHRPGVHAVAPDGRRAGRRRGGAGGGRGVAGHGSVAREAVGGPAAVPGRLLPGFRRLRPDQAVAG